MVVTAQKESALDAQSVAGALLQLNKTIAPITTNPERMGGTPVIGNERLPVEYLIGYLMKGGTVDDFVDEFSADREKVMAALQLIRERLTEGWLAEPVDY